MGSEDDCQVLGSRVLMSSTLFLIWRTMTPEKMKMCPYSPNWMMSLWPSKQLGTYFSTEVLLPVGNTQELARVLHQKNDQYGNPMSSAHWNPALDNHVYEA